MRIALARGAWLDHEPSWLTPADADGLLAALRAELGWEHRAVVLFGRAIVQPRLVAWAGSIGYRYSGQTSSPARSRRLWTVCSSGCAIGPGFPSITCSPIGTATAATASDCTPM